MASKCVKSRRQSSENRVNRPVKLRLWEDDAMIHAMDAVFTGVMGINRPALEYGIRSTTLKDQVAGRVVHGTKMGAKPYLTYQQEETLVSFLMNCAKMGYGKNRKDVLNIAHTTLVRKAEEDGMKFAKDRISQGWWVKFFNRWPQIRLRKGNAFPVASDQVTTYSVFKDYFDLLEETLTKYELKDKPMQIYNCNESGMPLEFKLSKFIAGKGAKKVQQCTSGNKTQITILACANAAGQAVPPMVIFSGKNFNSLLSKGEVPDTLYGMSQNGWMNQEHFAEWFLHHFLEHAVSSRPLMLLLDGHSSHYTLELVNLAAAHDVVIFCLPPHATADSQPLDTSCFKPLKTSWSDVCRKYLFTNPGRVITKFHFSRLFSQAWSNSMTINNITSRFQTTGIYLLDPNVILAKLSSSQHELHEGCSGVTEVTTFSPDLVKKYEKRFENAYNIYTDEKYVQWLRMFHPDHLPPG